MATTTALLDAFAAAEYVDDCRQSIRDLVDQ
jgi:hypothetical protein